MRREIAGFERHLYRLGLMADKGAIPLLVKEKFLLYGAKKIFTLKGFLGE